MNESPPVSSPTNAMTAEDFIGHITGSCRQILRDPDADIRVTMDTHLSGDPWVECAIDAGISPGLTSDPASLVQLRQLWTQRLATLDDSAEIQRGEYLVRQLDDAPRQLVFELMTEARAATRTRHTQSVSESDAIEATNLALGPKEEWIRPFARFASLTDPRLVIIPTWQCELRCSYCYIPKQDGRRSNPRTVERALDLLLASHRPKLMAQFFGGEALLEWALIQHALVYGSARAKALGKDLTFLLSSNGYTLDVEKLTWLAQYPVKLELSLDGDSKTQNTWRHTAKRNDDSYLNGIAPRAQLIIDSGIPYEVIMVVPPRIAGKMPENFFHIADLGFRHVQINFALGLMWTEEHKKTFAEALFKIGKELRKRWAAGDDISMVNLMNRPMPIRLNGEITVDYDGTLYGGNAFLHETEHKAKFVIGHLDDLGSFDRYWMDSPTNESLLEWSYPADVTANNLAVGDVMTSFVKWMQRDGVPGLR